MLNARYGAVCCDTFLRVSKSKRLTRDKRFHVGRVASFRRYGIYILRIHMFPHTSQTLLALAVGRYVGTVQIQYRVPPSKVRIHQPIPTCTLCDHAAGVNPHYFQGLLLRFGLVTIDIYMYGIRYIVSPSSTKM